MPALSLSKVGGRERKRTSPRCVKVEREKNTGPGLRILEEGEMIYCAVLGFQIDRAACASSEIIYSAGCARAGSWCKTHHQKSPGNC